MSRTIYRRADAAATVLASTAMPPAAPSEDAGCDAAHAAATRGSIRLLRWRLDRAHQLTARQLDRAVVRDPWRAASLERLATGPRTVLAGQRGWISPIGPKPS